MTNQPEVSANLSYTARLRRQITAFFDLGEIQTLCFDLGIDYDELKGENKTERIRELIEVVNKKSLLADLVSLCREAYPNEEWEEPANNSTIGLSLMPGEDGETAERGLEALKDLVRIPEARNFAIAFRTDFKAANDQIDVVSNYKEVHDMLHVLEYQSFNSMRQASRSFPDDELAIDTLMDAEVTLQQVIGTLKELSTRPTFGTNELVWVQDLEKGREHLTTALDGDDTKQLRRAIWLINRVIAIQPSQINTRLNAVARGLRLREIGQAMTQIHTQLSELNLDPQKLKQFATGALSIARLNEKLNELVDGHDSWQMIILELRRIGSSLDQDGMELEMSWPDLRLMLEPLYEAQKEEWQVDFLSDVGRLDTAVADLNPARMKRAFRRIDRRSGERFYKLDIDLRRLCEDLRRVAQPLASILDILE